MPSPTAVKTAGTAGEIWNIGPSKLTNGNAEDCDRNRIQSSVSAYRWDEVNFALW